VQYYYWLLHPGSLAHCRCRQTGWMPSGARSCWGPGTHPSLIEHTNSAMTNNSALSHRLVTLPWARATCKSSQKRQPCVRWAVGNRSGYFLASAVIHLLILTRHRAEILCTWRNTFLNLGSFGLSLQGAGQGWTVIEQRVPKQYGDKDQRAMWTSWRCWASPGVGRSGGTSPEERRSLLPPHSHCLLCTVCTYGVGESKSHLLQKAVACHSWFNLSPPHFATAAHHHQLVSCR
jgi:hypothetical protein